MNMFLDFVLWLGIFSASFFIICMGIIFCQYFARKSKIFEQSITNGWIDRNFDTPALRISTLLLIIFFPLSLWDEELREIIKDLAILVGALLGFPILIKRVAVMQEQAEAMKQQAEMMKEQSERMGEQAEGIKEQAEVMREQKDVTQQQMIIGQKQARIIEYNAASELLRSPHLSERMAGIQSLWRFVQTHPQDEYHNVMDVFIQFIKYPATYEWEEGTNEEDKQAGKRKDIHAILQHIGKEIIAGVAPYQIDLSYAHLEGSAWYFSYLSGANLTGVYLDEALLMEAHLEGALLAHAHLNRANLYGAYLEGANFMDARLIKALLTKAHLEGADLKIARLDISRLTVAHLEKAALNGACLVGAHLDGANLRGADLEGADLTFAAINGANFTDAKNLTQQQINNCVFVTDLPEFNNPPILPNGIEHTYGKMTQDEWKKERLNYLSSL